MLKRILTYFNKKKPTETAAFEQEDKTETDIGLFINDIEEALDITCPRIMPAACIFEAYSPERGENVVMAQTEFNRNEIPEDAKYSGAYYLDGKDIIVIGRKFPSVDFEKHELTFRNLTNADILFFLTHELRHVWQRKYRPEKYYKKNAVGFECINDPAEIDADAFALAYVYSDRTPFTYEDMPNTSEETVLFATADEGSRWNRVEEIQEEFNLDCDRKLADLKRGTDYGKINRMIEIMKEIGVI